MSEVVTSGRGLISYRTSSKNVSLHPMISPRVCPHERREGGIARRERVSTSDYAVAVAVSVVVVVVVVLYCYHSVIYSAGVGPNETKVLSNSLQSNSEVLSDG